MTQPVGKFGRIEKTINYKKSEKKFACDKKKQQTFSNQKLIEHLQTNRNYESLNLFNCAKISNRALGVIFSLPNLKKINFKNCKRIKDKDIFKAAENSSSINEITMPDGTYYCKKKILKTETKKNKALASTHETDPACSQNAPIHEKNGEEFLLENPCIQQIFLLPISGNFNLIYLIKKMWFNNKGITQMQREEIVEKEMNEGYAQQEKFCSLLINEEEKSLQDVDKQN